ncbi:hypothetical protein LRP67_20965 [Nocardioides sp. cx-169]|uniref:hypothetical protein n=1 Tax=Nocardioides sp. cx-169 TaxID=2899080 RepID=UPI001E2F65BA|nr:hypothetical protein [Nocardioides sp. cx-169]MCD4536570.1 hypothetical protein [Nocardioides sp. cx-169]
MRLPGLARRRPLRVEDENLETELLGISHRVRQPRMGIVSMAGHLGDELAAGWGCRWHRASAWAPPWWNRGPASFA